MDVFVRVGTYIYIYEYTLYIHIHKKLKLRFDRAPGVAPGPPLRERIAWDTRGRLPTIWQHDVCGRVWLTWMEKGSAEWAEPS